MGVLLFPFPGAGLAGIQSGRLLKGRGMTEPVLEVPGWAQLTQDRGIPSVPVPAGSWVCLGEGIPGKQQLKQEQMDPVALGKALECWRLRAGAAGVGSASCASARLLPSPGLGTERVMSQFLRSRKGFIFLGFQSTGAGTHSGSPAQCQVGQVPLWKPPLAKSLWAGSFPLLSGLFLGSCLDPGQGLCVRATFALLPNSSFQSLCLFLALFLSVGICLEQAAFAGGDLGRCGSFLPFLRHSKCLCSFSPLVP